eukprot:TRINITY_DN94118_c0_g1_i1.p1 TRINITY_DN94118_c0_g1~~TRINITY_DN94118_c0_g1_i1.p1  ORF type:complete len:776 (-),score=105.05 TRINITY_DN94118_c0_g1_i1:12-2339(-)
MKKYDAPTRVVGASEVPPSTAQLTNPRSAVLDHILSLRMVLVFDQAILAFAILTIVGILSINAGRESTNIVAERLVGLTIASTSATIKSSLFHHTLNTLRVTKGIMERHTFLLWQPADFVNYLVDTLQASDGIILLAADFIDKLEPLTSVPDSVWVVMTSGVLSTVFANSTNSQLQLTQVLANYTHVPFAVPSVQFSIRTGMEMRKPYSREALNTSVPLCTLYTGKFPAGGVGEVLLLPILSIDIPVVSHGSRLVIGADVPLQYLCESLKSVNTISANSVVALGRSDGLLIAVSITPISFLENSPTTDFVKLLSWPGNYWNEYPVLNEAGAQLKGSLGGSYERLSTDSASYVKYSSATAKTEVWITAQALPQEFNVRFFAVVILPSKDLTGSFNSRVRVALIIAISITIALLAITTVSWSIGVTAPVRHLSKGLVQLTRLDFSPTKVGRNASHLTELRTMQESYKRLENGLRAFAKYLPPSVVQVVLSSGSKPGLGMVPAETSVFFSDIVNFTSISESLEPMELVRVVGEYMEAMSQIILRNSGTLDKYIGDAIMAFWGAPAAVEGFTAKAALSAWQCQEALVGMRVDWQARGLSALRCRIGLHSGMVLVGNFGCESKMDYTVIGDTVNLASRLEGLNKRYGTQILVSETVSRDAAASSQFLWRPLGRVAVKGKTRGTEVYEICGRTESCSAAATEAVRQYSDALENFHARRFAVARQQFQQWREAAAHKHLPSTQHKEVPDTDQAVESVIAVCDLYIKTPPPSDWNGVDVMHEK